jgi:PAS domain S-box-containing protein
MSLRIQALIVAALVLAGYITALCLAASPLAHAGSNYSMDDPLRAIFFLAGFVSFVLVGLAYAAFDRFVCLRLQMLAQESWLASGQLPSWMNEKSELAALAGTIKQLFNRFNESAERENLIADHALDLICSLTPSRVIVAINPASLAQIGYAPVSLMGRPIDRILVEEEIAKLDQALMRARSEQSPASVDLVVKTMQGVLKDFRWTCEWSESGGSFYCVARDVSSAKQLERVKHEFFSMVSHDLRTPITSVRAFMTHLETGGLYGTLSEKGQRHLHGVEENLDRMIRLTTDLLDLDKLEAGQMQLELDVLKVQDLLNNSVDSVRQLAEQKRVTLVLQETDMEAYGDVHRLTQVLVNLLSNAIKFSPDDACVEINAVSMRHQVEIQVIDHGRGIPQAMLDIIFERYKQVEVSDHKVKKGAGLGLAIAKALIDAHNGQIGVTSEEGKGTKFWFRVGKPKGGRSISASKN